MRFCHKARIALFLMILLSLSPIVAPAAQAGRTPPENRSAYGMDLFGLGWQWVFPRVEAYPRLSGSIRLDMLDDAIHQAADAGVRWSRLSVWWCMVEPERGQFFWDDLDAAIQISHNYGIATMPVLLYPPYWAVKNGVAGVECVNNMRKNYPPQDMADWENFVRAMVRRYGPQGKNLVNAWEIWNEPDLPEFLSVDNDWGNGTVPVYAELLSRAAAVIRAEAPGAKILFGGLSDINGPAFLDKVLSQTGPYSVRNSFDIVSVHAYSQHAWKLSQIRNVLAKYGLGDRPLWDTELNYLGWSYGDAETGLAGLFQLVTDQGVQRSFWYLSTTSHWGPGIFHPRWPEWDPLPFVQSPFYETYRAQAAAFALPAAPTPLLPGATPKTQQVTFEWSAVAPGTYPLAGYKLQVDTRLFMDQPYFADPLIDAWVSGDRLTFVPFLVSSGGGMRSAVGVAAPADVRLRQGWENVTYQAPAPLSPGRYYWRIAAVDVQGNVGPYSPPQTFQVRFPYSSFLPLTTLNGP